MCRTPKSKKLSFFKVLIKDFTTTLRLPPVLVKKHRKILPENAKLRISSGETWDVKLEESDGADYCFTGGWKKFAEDLGLEMGEFLVFWFNSKSTFDVSVYGINGCERKISVKNPDDLDSGCKFICGATTPDNSTSKEMNPQFKIVLSKHAKYRVWIQKEFAKVAGLMGKKVVVLQYGLRNRYWTVTIKKRPTSRYSYGLDLTVGWAEFVKENRLVLGRTYLLELNRVKNVIKVTEHK